MGLRQDLQHVRHVKVADVGAEERVELGAERIGPPVERPGIEPVVGLGAEVEAGHEAIANVLLARDPARGEVVQVVEAEEPRQHGRGAVAGVLRR